MFKSNKKSRPKTSDELENAAIGILFRDLLGRLNRHHPGLIAEMTAEVEGDRAFARGRPDLFSPDVDAVFQRAVKILGHAAEVK